VRKVRHLLLSYSHLNKSLSPEIAAGWDLTILGGLLGSLFSVCQFVVSPRLGHLSDKLGRRPVLLASMVGNLLSAVLWLFASNFGVYALSRVVGGLSEGNVQLSIAAISDVTSPETRSKSLALVGIAFSVAFTLGPSLGAYFASKTFGLGSRLTVLGYDLSLNSYAVPAAVTVALLLIETVYLALRLPETRWDRDNQQDKDEKDHAPTRTLAERKARLGQLELVHCAFLFFFSGAEFTLTFLTFSLFDYTNKQNGALLGFVGILSSVLQGGYTRRKAALPAGSSKLVVSGMRACTLSLALLAALPFLPYWPSVSSPASVALYSAAAGLAFVSATVVNSLNALASLETGQGIEKGRALGRFRSSGQLGRALGPVACTGVYFCFGPEWAYGIAAVGCGVVAGRMARLVNRAGPVAAVQKEKKDL